MEVAGEEKSQARCGHSRGDEAAHGARCRGEGAAPVLRRRRRQGSDVLGQRGEAKPGGSERAPVAGWRCGGDVVDGEARGRMGEKGIGRGVARCVHVCEWRRCGRMRGRDREEGVGARVIGAPRPWAKWTVGKQAGLAPGLSFLSHSKENKNKTEIRKKRKRG